MFRAVLPEEVSEILGVGFDEDSVEELIEILRALDDPPRVRLLAAESVLKWLRSDFVLASTAADLIAAETLSVRTTDEPFENMLVVTDEEVVSVVPAGETVAGLVSDDSEFVDATRNRWASAWETGEEFGLRTPAHSQVADSLTAEFGADVESDFEEMVGALATTRSAESSLDEVDVSVLVAAKHEEMLYDVSKWGERVGVASKATFSRAKNHLEERGLIETEKVPIDVGRPRQRLLLGDERLREADAEELVSVATSLLSTTGS
ncbi:hypothetical protein C450_20491 [Halococcus salifodinae DSM 8989]|uniref:Uncharacterized protein n=1 Tax=Halococcus salifodinae DSM 8989 TaxID=1227456 RepID=M0MPV0_9EURY|nr:hypothetical protein C450_20491 [Halococcus salifodinae DSM 8989]